MSDPQQGAPEPPSGQSADSNEASAADQTGNGQVFSATDADADKTHQPDSLAEGVEGAGAEQRRDEAAGDDPADALERLQDELKQATEETLRAKAEMENVRKRAARDADNARKFALEKLMGDMLDVIESLERGLAAADGEQVSVEQLREGTDLTHKMLGKVLNRHGLEELSPEDELFDPERHEALSMIPTDECDPDTVVQVVQKGYVLNGRLLRAARVLVSKAPE